MTRRRKREVGALLETRAFHPGRSARAHLAALAASNAIPFRRVGEVLGLVGLERVAGRRAGKLPETRVLLTLAPAPLTDL